MTYLKYISTYLVILLTSLLSIQAAAQPFSYVYIQGDKETPFYVKMEDVMQPRYGKNYCIISQLAPGPINIQILFQQNAYPPQRFTIQVPENGYRGFMLIKKDNTFSLYDLQQQFYLPAGNGVVDDHAPDHNPNNNFIPTKTASTQVAANAQPVVNTQPMQTDTGTANQQVVSTQPAQTNPGTAQQNNTTASTNNQPHFIENIELDNKRDVQPVTTNTQSTAEAPPPLTKETVAAPTIAFHTDTTHQVSSDLISTNTKAPIVNSDCPQPMNDDDYNELYRKVLLKSDESRLKYMINRLDNCFTTTQIRELTKTLNNDPERYAYLKRAYSRVTDQSNFPKLEDLLTTQEWKSYFLLIMP